MSIVARRGRWILALLFTTALFGATVSRASGGGRGRRGRHQGGWDKGWYESGWYDPFWVRLRRTPSAYQDATPVDERSDYDPYAAIAYSPSTGRYGYSHGQSCRRRAECVARAHCKADDARTVVWCHGAWCALALGKDSQAYGYGWSSTAQGARSRALDNCRKRTTDCYIAACVFSGY